MTAVRRFGLLGPLSPAELAGIAGACFTAAVATASAYSLGPIVAPLVLAAAGVAVLAAMYPAGGICLAFLAAPLELYSLPLPTGTASASEGILAAVGISYLARLAFRPGSVRTPGVRDLPFAILLGAVALGIGVAESPAAAVRILILWTLFYCVFLQVQTLEVRDLGRILTCLALGGAVLGAIGTVQFIASGGGGLYAGGAGADVRVAGTFGQVAGDSNYYASFLAMAALSSIALGLALPRRYGVLLLVTVATVTGLAFSLSRGGMLGFAAGLLVLAVVWRRARWGGAGLAVGLVALTIVGANPLAGSTAVETVEQRLGSVSQVGQTSIDTRPQLFRAAVDMTLERPLTGVGMNEYAVHAERRGLSERGRPPETAHNMYLSLSAETGLLGLAGLLLFLGFLARRAAQAVKARGGIQRGIAIGCAAALFGFAVQGLTVSSNRNNLLWATFLVVAGVLVAIADRLERERKSRTSPEVGGGVQTGLLPRIP